MQFKVPQFLDIEDKIFGPFTFRQFVYLAGGAGLCFILFKSLGLLIGAIPILIIAGLAGTLTFYRPNGKPFINLLESGIRFALQDKLYIWKRKQIKKEDVYKKEKESQQKREPEVHNPRLNKSKLQDLSWSLDVLDLNKNKEEK